MESSYHGNFVDATEVFQTVIEKFPSSPVGYFLKAAALESYMSDFSTFEPEGEFYTLLDQAIEKGKSLLVNEANAPELHFFIGASYFYKGFHYARKKNYLKAFAELGRAKPWLKKAVAMDSTFYDAYLGLGILEYLAAKVKDYIVPFTSGKYDEPIQEISLATKGKYTYLVAQEALVIALAGASRWTEAIERATSLIEAYPKNRLFYWALVEIYRRKGDPEGVISIGYKLLELIREFQTNHYYNQSLIRSYLAEAHLQLGQPRECVRHCDSILSLLEEKDTDQNEREVRKAAMRLKHEAAKALLKKVDR